MTKIFVDYWALINHRVNIMKITIKIKLTCSHLYLYFSFMPIYLCDVCTKYSRSLEKGIRASGSAVIADSEELLYEHRVSSPDP